MFNASDKIAVIAAHPDDEILGCGGVLKKLSSEGHEINVLILGEGVTSRNRFRDTELVSEELNKLKENSRKANQKVGVKNVIFKDFPDNRFDSVDMLDIVKEIESFLQEFPANTIFTHHRGDLNIDHKILNQAVLTACRPISNVSPECILAFEVLSSTEWSFGVRENIFSPNVFINIEKELETKIEALSCYEAEVRSFPFPRSPEAVEHQAKRYGAVSNLPAAEAFELLFFRRKRE